MKKIQKQQTNQGVLFDYKNVGLTTLKNIATDFADKLQENAVISLYGELGVGKTAFASYLIKALVKEKNLQVISPTFNLVQIYNSTKGQVWHFDLYRLKTLEEVYELGLEEALASGITIIEWPHIVESLLPFNTIKIFFSFSKKKTLRNIKISDNLE
jgi:tRNA threonylcarbamoyladenosine biosynthesis protein TsaE